MRRLAAKSKNLLNRLHSGDLSLKEFLTKCAYWALEDGFDELKPKAFPTKPSKVIELEKKDKHTLDWAKIYRDFPEVERYYNQRFTVFHWNKGTKEWLQDVYSYLPETDIVNREKVEARIREFQIDVALEEEAERIKAYFDAKEY